MNDIKSQTCQVKGTEKEQEVDGESLLEGDLVLIKLNPGPLNNGYKQSWARCFSRNLPSSALQWELQRSIVMLDQFTVSQLHLCPEMHTITKLAK